MRKVFIVLFLLFVGFNSYAQKSDFQTLVYYQDDTLNLEMDLFLPKNEDNTKTPLMIFVHGGGFSNGDRKSGHKLGQYLSEKGIAVASISYSLYMKGKSFSCDGQLSEKVKAIQIGVNQLWLASSFFLENSEKYNIDSSEIFISGSSAGAETCLHAAYWDREMMKIYDKQLPLSFKYAGIVSGAGAIMDLSLITKENLIPTMLFHGNGDNLVPYGTGAHHYCPPNSPGWLMLFGSYSIYQHISELNGHVFLVTFCGAGHENSWTLFGKDINLIEGFIDEVRRGEVSNSHLQIPTGKSNKRSEAYHFCD